MPKKLANALTPLSVKNAKTGRHADGGGLHLLVKKTGARSWVFRFMLNGKSRDVGLSRCQEAIALLRKSGEGELTLAQARDVAANYRIKVRAGIDPLEQREQDKAAEAAKAQAAQIKKVILDQRIIHLGQLDADFTHLRRCQIQRRARGTAHIVHASF